MKYWVWVIALSFMSFANASAQVTIQGFVKTKDSLPVVRADILLHTIIQGDERLAAFTKTDAQGWYALAINDSVGDYLLTVRRDGYQEVRARLEFRSNADKVVKDFVLQSSVSFLDTVRVNLKFRISNTGDTITFNPNAYSLNNERNIEQLLSRVPGIEVRDDGKIFFNGRSIDAVLLDGDDLFRKNYQLLTRNAASEIIDKIQIIKNFQKNQLLKDFGRGGEQVINLVLKDQYKKYLFGNVGAGYGLDKSNAADVFLIRLFPGMKAQVGLNYNTRGITYGKSGRLDIDDYVALMNDFFSFTPVAPLVDIRPYFFEGVPLYYQKDNKSLQATSNVLIKSKKWENLVNVKYAEDKLLQNQTDKRIFEDGSIQTDKDSGRLRDRVWDFNWTSSMSSAKESLYFKTSLTAQNQRDLMASLSNHTLNVEQLLRGENIYGQAGINYFKKIREGVLWSASAGYFQQSLNDDLVTDPDIIFWQFPNDNLLYNLRSAINYNVKYLNVKSGISFSKTSWKHDIRVAFSSENRLISSGLNAKRIDDDSSSTAFANDNYLNTRKISIRYESTLPIRKGQTITLTTVIGENFFDHNTVIESSGDELFVYDYSFTFKNSKRSSNLAVGIGLRKTESSNEMFMADFVQTGFHELRSGQLDLKGTGSLYLQSNYNLTSIRLGWIIFGMASYSRGRTYYAGNLTNTGAGMVRSVIFYPHNTDQLLFMMNSDKTLGALPFHLKSNISFSYFTQSGSYRNKISNSGISSFNISNQLRSHLKSVVNGDYTFEIQHTGIHTFGADYRKSKSNVMMHKVNVYLTGLRIFDISASLMNVTNKKIRYNETFVSLALEKKVVKEKLFIELSLRNILNVSTISTRNISLFYTHERSMGSRGRELFLSLKYNLR